MCSFIGPATFYNRYNLGPQYLLTGNVIYATNFFEPKKWITAGAPSTPYGGTGRCCDLATHEACGGCSGDANVTLDKASLKTWLEPAVSFGDKYQVPVWIDQWGVFSNAGTSDADRAHYLQDLLALFGDAQLHWAMWIWRRPLCGQDGFALYCENPDGSFALFETAVSQLARWIG